MCFAECVFCDAKKPLDLLCSALQIVAGRLRGPVWRMRRLPFRGITMLKNFDDMQKNGKEHMDSTMKAWGQMSKGVQAIAAETADYSKRAFEEGSAALEKMFGAQTLEKTIEIQAAYAKTAYEGFVAQATKMGELYADLAKETYKPFETLVGKSTIVK